MLEPREIGRNGGHFAVIGGNITSRLLNPCFKGLPRWDTVLGNRMARMEQRRGCSMQALHQDAVKATRARSLAAPRGCRKEHP